MVKYKYTNENLIEILQQTANKLGRIPTYRDVKQGKTIHNRFGSWENALKAAGLTIEYKNYNIDAIISKRKNIEFKDVESTGIPKKYYFSDAFYKEFAKEYTYEDFLIYREYIIEIYKDTFQGNRNRYPHNFWDGNIGMVNLRIILDYIFDEILHEPYENIKYKTLDFFEEYNLKYLRNKYTKNTFLKTFYGDIFANEINNKESKKCYGKTSRLKELSDNDIIKMYEDLCDKLGRQAKVRDIINSKDIISIDNIRDRFGSLNNLRQKSRWEYDLSELKYPKDILINKLANKMQEFGRRLTIEEINSQPELPKLNIMKKHFEIKGVNDLWNLVEKVTGVKGYEEPRCICGESLLYNSFITYRELKGIDFKSKLYSIKNPPRVEVGRTDNLWCPKCRRTYHIEYNDKNLILKGKKMIEQVF